MGPRSSIWDGCTMRGRAPKTTNMKPSSGSAAPLPQATQRRNSGWAGLSCTWKNAPTDAEALDWLRKSAGQGYPDAQYKLAVYYAIGAEYGVKKDERQALQWYLRAGAQGHAGALYNAGFMYLLGEGTVKDEDRAFALLTEASEKGSSDAKGLLAENESLSKRLK